ncbi:hypothetical protein RSAG8_04591, partial [Rhizoctonia solani AG-8 WAC10335]
MQHPSLAPLPTQWPVGYENAHSNLSSLLEYGPRYEESWNGDVMSMLIHMFPVISPENYVIKPQCNLRKPRLLLDGENLEQAGPRTSIESRGHATAHTRWDHNHEPERYRPDFIIDKGARNSQKLVAVIELKREGSLDIRSRERFADYCNRVVEYDHDVTTGTSALLIVGGTAYAWDRDQIDQLALRSELSDADLEQSISADVDTIGFLEILATIRNRFVQSIVNNV